MPTLCIHLPVELKSLFFQVSTYIYLPMCQKPPHPHLYTISGWIPAGYLHITH